ncbi:MAG: hypothetical protein K0Q95_2390 [Bacteroidota bacterium]|jgi:hypothetical protein|nr:hypothetical protein [Bacteroidota bacterium]
MPIRQLTVVLFTLVLHFQNYAQDAGYLRLKIHGVRKPKFEIDNIRYTASDTVLNYSSGSHHLQIKVPTTIAIDTTIFIKANDTSRYTFKLQHSPEYLTYLAKYSDYRSTRNRRYFVSPIWMGITIGTGALIGRYLGKKQYDLAIDAREQYGRLGNQSRMNEEKQKFQLHKKKYDRLKTAERGFYAFSGLIFANYVRILIKQYKTPIPQYSESGFFSKMQFDVYPLIVDKKVQCGLSIQF